MNSPIKRVALLLITVFTLVVGGCQTSKGFGEDVEKVGEKIQEKAG